MAYVSTHRSVFSPLLSLLHRDVKFAALKSLPNYVEKPDIADLRDDTAEASLEDLPNVVSVSEDVTAFEAFRKMFEQDVSTVAITEKETGMLLENLSISDFRVLTKDTIGELMSPVRNYLDKVVGMNIPPVRVLDDSIVEDALLKMMASCIHHVWVVDSDDVPTGVISMSDIVSVIFEQESAERQEFVEE
ncbi:hypothetical protein BKA69DRAFT_427505 [Paraphysoderma sedebokerense]|nr:hypothetical protein BKA69DRAFT_427505 [Paraphysoderma sedebokerense]